NGPREGIRVGTAVGRTAAVLYAEGEAGVRRTARAGNRHVSHQTSRDVGGGHRLPGRDRRTVIHDHATRRRSGDHHADERIAFAVAEAEVGGRENVAPVLLESDG